MQDINMLPSKILIPSKNSMRFELRIEVIDAPGNALECKKIGYLKKNCPTRMTPQ